jgi:NitT/TauT family transport system substrate-binding protein
MKKYLKIISLFLSLVMVFSFAACNKENTASETDTSSDEREVKTNIAALKSSSGISIAKLYNDRSYGYTVNFYDNTDEICNLIKSGEADIACLPLNLAAKLYNETDGNIEILAVNTEGNLYALSTDSTISNVAFFKDKKIYAAGKGTSYEYMTDYILEEKGISNENIEYVEKFSDLVTKAEEGEADIIIAPEPYASACATKNSAYGTAISLTDTWKQVCDTEPALECTIVRKDYLEANPDIITEFMTFYEVSINFINMENNTIPPLIKGYGLVDSEDYVISAIANANIVFVEGEEMKTLVKSNFEILNSLSTDTIGGKIPDDDIYYLG